MDIKEDYMHFSLENSELLNALEENSTLCFDLIQPVVEVLNFLNKNNLKVEGEDEQDCIDVFTIGFRYLYTEIENIKTILEDNFDSEIEEMIEFDHNIYLYLRLDEIDSLYEENNKTISALSEQMKSTIEYRTKLNKKAIDTVEAEMSKALLKIDEVTVADQFMDFADTLGIEI